MRILEVLERPVAVLVDVLAVRELGADAHAEVGGGAPGVAVCKRINKLVLLD